MPPRPWPSGPAARSTVPAIATSAPSIAATPTTKPTNIGGGVDHRSLREQQHDRADDIDRRDRHHQRERQHVADCTLHATHPFLGACTLVAPVQRARPESPCAGSPWTQSPRHRAVADGAWRPCVNHRRRRRAGGPRDAQAVARREAPRPRAPVRRRHESGNRRRVGADEPSTVPASQGPERGGGPAAPNSWAHGPGAPKGTWPRRRHLQKDAQCGGLARTERATSALSGLVAPRATWTE